MDKSKNRTDLLAAGRKKLQQFRQKKGGRKPGKPGGDSGEVDEHISAAPEGDRSGSEQCNGDTAAVNGAEVAEQCNGDGSGAGVPVEDVRDEAGGDAAEVSASGIKECRVEGEDLAATPVILENGRGGDIAASLSGTVEGRGDEVAANSSGMVDEGSVTQSLELVSDPMSIGPAEELHREETGSPSSRAGLEVGFPVNEDREHIVSENSDAGTIRLNEETTTTIILENGGDDEGERIVDSTPSIAIPISATAEVFDGEGAETTSSSADMGVEHVVSESSEVGTSGLHEETIASLTQGNVEEIEVEVNDIDERNEEVSHREHLKMPSATQDSVGEYGSHVDDAKEGGGTDKEGTEQLSVTGDVVVESKPVGEPVALEEEKVDEDDSLVPVDSNSDCRLESLRSHLYLTNVEKDFLQLQLAELVVDSSDDVSKLRGMVKEALEIKDAVSEELVRCRSELRAAAIEKEKLENQCSLMKEEINQSQIGASELQNKLEQSQEEHSRVSAELADCSCSLEVLRKENLELAAKLVSETDARTKLVEENTRLAYELLEQKDKLLIALDKQMQLEGNLRETEVSFEELTMEHLYLSNNVVVYESKIKELDGFRFEAREEVPSSNNSRMEGSKTSNVIDDSRIRHEGCGIDVAPGTSVDSAALQKDDDIVSGSSDAFGLLKRHLEDALNGLDNLEKSVQDVHFHTASLSRSAGRAAAPGISKLIQAFESKTHVEDAPEMVPVTEGGWSEDPYISVSREVCSLKDSLKLMELDIGMVQEHTRIPSEQLEMECEAQRQQNNILQVKITTLVEELSKYKSRTDDLQSCVNEIQQSANYQSEMFLSQVESLQKEVNDDTSILKQERVFLSGVISGAVEKLNAYTGLLLSEDLDIGSTVLASVDAAMEAIKSLHEELEAAHLNNNTLSASCEELNRLCTDIQGRKDFTVGILNKYYRSLKELVLHVGEADTVVISEEQLPDNYEKLIQHLQVLMDERLHLLSTNSKLESELLNRNQVIEELNMRCATLGNKLEDLCHDNDRLESVLAKNTCDIEEFNRRCLALMQKLEESDCTEDPETIPTFADNTDNDFYNSALFRLEAFVASHIKKYEGAVEQINLSKNYLRDVFKLSEISAISWSSPLLTFLRLEIVPHVYELQEKLQLTNTSNLQLESELYNLREGFGKVDETLKVAQSELHLKASELEQSEQRLASVREKLSMAVAKGKGLIVQRDSLKQSLMEKSSELENCTQELMLKDALLHEVEAKLKACSEVERVEALESELSYIRNSATALRDSFLLKDSVLQRIEEVLEDLDLPEHFHSKDIIEKIELLARLVADNTSFSMTDWDQKSSAGVSHSDAGFVGTDTWKDELAPSSNPEFDEFKRKHEELQNKLYVLAEHNNALEQLLLEKNNLLQKWEEVLNGIDVPSQLQSLDPEDRIEWSKRAFAEVQQERDSLHLKIENLEVSSDMLIVDLEESHKKISELSAEVVAVKYEKEFFSESLNKLRYEYLGLSEKAVHDEIDNDNLRRELDDLHEKMVKNSESKDHEVDKEMWRLHDLIINCLPDTDRFETPSGGSGIECLERLLKNLLDHYSTLQAQSMHKDLQEEFVPRESSISLDKTESGAVSEDMDQELPGLKLKLDEATRDLVLVTEERNKALEKYHSLMLETETISNQVNILQEERTKDVEKYQSLELELEAVIKQRDALQEQLDQEEQKSVAVESSLLLEIEAIKNQQNLLHEERTNTVEKYQSLVLELEATMKQRDAFQEQLDQGEQKSVVVESLLLEIEALKNQQHLLEEERTDAVEKYQSLLVELETTVKQRDALQEQLDQEEQKSVAVDSLQLEIEAIRNQQNLLQEERANAVEKYRSLVAELETIVNQRDALPEQLDQEEQKSVAVDSLLLEIEAIRNQQNLLQEERANAVEKYRSLVAELETIVKQRDALQEQLDQDEQKSVAVDSLLLEIDAIRSQHNLLQEERTNDIEKYRSIVLELEATVKQRDALQEQLDQDAQKIDAMIKQRDVLQEQLDQDAQKIEAMIKQTDVLQEQLEQEGQKLVAMMKQNDALREQVDQEAQKSASAREKLIVAVRKGKTLVQQRDSLKQTIEEMNTALEHLKIEQSQRVESLESDISLLTNRLAETEHSFHDNNQYLSRILTALEHVDVGSEVGIFDPVQKIEANERLCHELRSAAISSEHEAIKSRHAAELLHAELTEVQERSDALQEELIEAIAAKSNALSRLEQFMFIHSEERKKQIDTLARLESGIYELKKDCFEFSSLLSNVFSKDMDLFRYLEAFIESLLKQMNGENDAEVPVLASSTLLFNHPVKEGRFLNVENDSVTNINEQCDESSITEHLALAASNLQDCIREYDDAKENIHDHSFTIDQQATNLLNTMQTVQRNLASHKKYSESLKRDVTDLESMIKAKGTEVCTLQKNVCLLYEACSSSIMELGNRKALVDGNRLPPENHVHRKSGVAMELPSYSDGQSTIDGHKFLLDDDSVRMVAETLLSTLKGSSDIREMAEANQKELKSTIADLQRELQEKDIQMNSISADLVSQIREAESLAQRSVMDLDSARSQVFTLENQVEVLANDRKILESRVNELKDRAASSIELQETIKSLGDALSAKDQEIEGLMQALDEEESQMEELGNRNIQLENILHENNLKLESLEASRSKVVSKLSTTMSKFDELHNLSESFLAEIENLQSQLQGRDSEISFLRQEVTRCTNDILTSQETTNKHSSDIHELLKWMEMMISRCGSPRAHHSDQGGSQIREYTEILEKKIVSIMTELDDLHIKVESNEALLQIERGRVEELSCKTEFLESSLREKETQIELSEGRTDSSQRASINSPGASEIEQVIQRDQVTLGPIKTHVRGSRKVNNDYIAIAVDPEKGSNVLEDEDDDKAHGFKSLTMSRIVPRASRPISDRIDGIWVSGDRLLMRQPTLRLGLMIYWIALHILLASAI